MESSLARSFGRTADRYESGRPDWPLAAIDAVGLSAESVVLDLGAGTGKLTRVLVRRFAQVLAVEPLDQMRAVLTRVVPGVEAFAGSAERIPLADETVDAVFSGDAFHWFDRARAIPQIERVLRPGGTLAVLFTYPTGATEPEIDGVHELLERYRRPREHPTTRFESGEWLADFNDTSLGALRDIRLPFTQDVTAAQLVDYFASVSWIAALTPDERDTLLERVGEFLGEAVYRRSWEAVAYIWTRQGAGAAVC
jgi:SAM-dependent methyltransferase